MNLIQRIVKAINAFGWTRASIRSAEERADGKTPPFSQQSGVDHYGSWVYAAASINGNAVAALPLRLYVRRSPSGARKLFKTRPVDKAQRAYLLGDAGAVPSTRVMTKLAEIGSDFEEVTDNHPLLNILSRSNPFLNGFDATVLRIVWQELCGNAYLNIVNDSALGVPSELWPMPPQWTRIVTDERDFIGGYIYGAERGKQVGMTAEEVIHFKRPNPRDLFYGMGKLEAAWGAANANAALHEMDLAMFRNHARPDWLAVVKGMPDPDEIDRFEAKVREQLRGTRKSGSFLVTSAEIDIKAMQFPTKDIAGRDEIVEEIAAVFGVPVSMLKANDPNLASASTGFAQWRESTVLPLCRMDEEVLNQRLLPLFGLADDAVLAYDNPVPRNRQLDLTERQAAVAGGWMTPNEAREAQGLERLEDEEANKLHVNGAPLGGQPQGGLPLGMGASLAGQAAPVGGSGVPPIQEASAATEPPPEAMRAAEAKVLMDIVAQVNGRACTVEAGRALAQAMLPQVAPSLLDAMFAGAVQASTAPSTAAPCGCGACDSVEKSVSALDLWTKASTGDLVDDDLLKRWLGGVEGVLKDQVESAVAMIRREGKPTSETVERVVSLLNRSRWNRDLSDALQPYLRRALEHGAALGMQSLEKLVGSPAVAQMGWSSDQLAAYAEKASIRLSSTAATAVNGYTEVAFRRVLSDSLERGETTGEMAARVQEWAGKQNDPERSTRSRAMAIARTEAARAASTAEQDAWKQTGLVKGKTWLLAPDPCQFCAAAAKRFGSKSVGLDEPFFAKGEVLTVGKQSMTLDYDDVMGAPLHPNCRCTVQAELVDDYKDIAEEAIRRVRGEAPRSIEP